MASIYKRGGKKNKDGIYYIDYTDANGKRRTEAGSTDKAATEALARKRESDAMLIRKGIIDRQAENWGEAELKPVSEHLADMKRDMEARGDTAEHADKVHNRVLWIIEHAKIEQLSQLTPVAINGALGQLRNDGAAKRTLSHYLRAVKIFTRWLRRNNRLRTDMLMDMPVKVAISRSEMKHPRRALTVDEFNRIVAAAENGPVTHGMTGTDRAMLYRVAANTGLRVNKELRFLTPESFDIGNDEPSILVMAKHVKRRRDDRQRITPDLADMLRPWLAAKPAGQQVFNLPHETNVVRMLRKDLERARQAWIEEAGDDGAERKRREESDTLRYKDSSGAFADFHALRHTYITWLIQSGASVKVTQELARHSSPLLTLGVYSHVTLHDQNKALAALPVGKVELKSTGTAREAVRATGTDHHTLDAAGNSFSGLHSDRVTLLGKRKALIGTEGTVNGKGRESDNPPENLVFSGGNTIPGGGIRTHDQGIMSSLGSDHNGSSTNDLPHEGGPASVSHTVPNAQSSISDLKSYGVPNSLGTILAAWDSLPSNVQATILAMVKAALHPT